MFAFFISKKQLMNLCDRLSGSDEEINVDVFCLPWEFFVTVRKYDLIIP